MTSVAGAFKSTDGGANWAAINTGLDETAILSLTVDPLKPTTLYAGTGDVFRSVDAGASWRSIGAGLVGYDFYSLVVDPVSRNLFVAGSASSV